MVENGSWSVTFEEVSWFFFNLCMSVLVSVSEKKMQYRPPKSY